MAAGKISIQANDGKVAGIMFEDGASSNVTVTVPKEGGVVATEAYADTKVSKTGDETIAGVKTFSDSVVMSGNVGIGGTPSAWNTSIKAIEQGSRTSLFELNGTTVLNNNSYYNSSPMWVRKTANACTMYEQLNGGHYWSTAPSNTAGSPIAWTNDMTLDNNGNLLLTAGTGGLGYGAGAGGTVTQLTSKSTAVTLNRPSGIITMNNAALAAGESVYFILYNSLITGLDQIVYSGHYNTVNPQNYRFETSFVTFGSATIRVTSLSNISLYEAVQFNFSILKGAQA